MPACSARTRSHSLVGAVAGAATRPGRRRRRRAGRLRSTVAARASAAPAKPGATPPAATVVHVTPRAAERGRDRGRHVRAIRDDRARGRRRRAGGRRPSARRRSSRTGGCSRRCSPGPPRPAPSAPVVTASSTWGSDVTSSVRTTSRSRGWSITASSDPPAKITWPLHQDEVLADEVGARRPEVLGLGIEPSERPPVAADPAPAPAPVPARRGAAERGGDHPGHRRSATWR